MTPPPPVPSVEEMEIALGKFGACAGCCQKFWQLIDALKSGDYALISTADREAALTNAVAAGLAQGSTDHDYNGPALEALARTLLHLEPQ